MVAIDVALNMKQSKCNAFHKDERLGFTLSTLKSHYERSYLFLRRLVDDNR